MDMRLAELHPDAVALLEHAARELENRTDGSGDTPA